MTEGTADARRFYRRWNWWKIGFFVTLVMFEFAREWAVLASATKAEPNVSAYVFNHEGYTVAQGRWKRIDNGGALVPSTVAIQCLRERGVCIEANVMVFDTYVGAPDISVYPAKFSDDAVSFENDAPDCVTYSTRIDLRLKKAFSVRQKKQNPTHPQCKASEERMEMQLADGFDPDRDPLKGHFVPLISLLGAAQSLKLRYCVA